MASGTRPAERHEAFADNLLGYVASPDEEGVTVSPVRIRPLGGAAGCLTMIAVSILASIVLTVLLNLILR